MKRNKMLALTIAATLTSFAAPSSIAYGLELASKINKQEIEDLVKQLTTKSNIKTSSFTLSSLDGYKAYEDKFKVSGIKSYSNNGGQYSSSSLNKAFDGNLQTHFETGKPNSASHINEVIITFSNVEEINRIVYASRQDASYKGFATKFSIYSSLTEDSDDFELVGTGTATRTSGYCEFKFENTEFKRLKFVFDESYDSWSSAAEFMFFREDTLRDSVDSLFTDNTFSTINKEFTLDDIENMVNQAKEHPLYNGLKEKLELAKSILNSEADFAGRIIVAEQHGNMVNHANKNLKFGFGSNIQPTGVAALAGETITVYLEADESGPLPQLYFSQQEGSFANWGKTVNLKPGKNVIVVPEIHTDNWYKNEVTKGGAIYIINPYTGEEQGDTPVIRIEGGERIPFLTADTDVEEFKKFLIEYKERLDTDKAENIDITKRSLIDTFEFVSDHLIFTGTATGAYEAYINQGIDPMATVNSYNTYMDNIFKYYGLDGSSLQNDPMYIRENIRLAQPFGYMYAAGNHIGVQRDVMISMLIPFEDKGSSWGLTHEIGHRIDVNARLFGETTNNMIAMLSSVEYGDMDNRIPYESHVYKNVVEENLKSYRDQGYFERLAVFWQLEMYYDGYWAELNKLYRERDVQLDNGDVVNSRMQYLVEFSSDVLELDLSEYFARHGFEVNDDTKEKVSKYEKPSKKIWYLNNTIVGYDGNGFTSEVSFNLDKVTNIENNSITLNFSTSNSDLDNLLGYEIIKDGKVIAFTSNSSYTDTNVDFDFNSTYEVVPYGKDLSTGDTLSVNIYEPTLLTTGKVTIKLGEDFNPLDYVKAYDYKGNILSGINVTGSVNNLEKGIYTVNYSITDNDITKSQDVLVEVVSSYDYLSNLTWKSGTTQYGSIRKNNNLKLLVNGEVKSFDKGIGVHANAEIVYDLSDKDYESFEALVGIDRGIAEQKNSSVIFKIYVDGEEVYNSGKITWYDEAKVVNIDVNNVKEFKIVVNDSDNGNTSDHGVIAETKLTTNNSKPEIKVEDKKYKLEESIDFMEGVIAKDIEDGDLTSKVQIVSNTYEEGKLGRFEVVYKVIDGDGNVVEKKSYITVYEDLNVYKSRYGEFNTLNEYNDEFKIPVVSATNNGGNYGSSAVSYAIDNNINTHFETGKPNSDSFKNEAVFDLGEAVKIDKIAYAARRSGKGFATSFEIYVSEEATGDDFVLAGVGNYNSGNYTDVIEIDITKTLARRVKFKFTEVNGAWASIGEMSFYREDILGNKVNNELFTDSTKTKVSEKYNTLGKLSALEEEVKNHMASSLFEGDLNKAKELILSKYPTINVDDAVSTKLGVEINLNEGFSANDTEDGDLTNSVEISESVNFNKAGKYDVTYTVVDSHGNKTSKVKVVYVVDMENYNYLSDIEWKSVNTSYGQVRKDTSVSSNILRLTDESGNIVSYEKGIGAHSTSTITYDLTKGDYGYFSTFVGVDRQMYGTVGSVSFEVWLDGEKVYDTGVMNSKEQQKYIEVDVAGHSELKLVVTDGKNGNGSDHGTFGDAKLYSVNNSSLEVNRESLDSLIETILSLNEEDYTSESFENLKNILDRVSNSLSDGYNQEEVDDLYSLLNEGYKYLVKATDYRELENILDRAKNIDKSLYTEKTVKALETIIEKCSVAMENKTSTQEEIDTLVQEINAAIENLKEGINLSEVVTISDKYLRETIKDTLNLPSDTITVFDMYNLTTLISQKPINNLDGIQYAKNLESIDISYSEIQDISYLKELKNLKSISIKNGYIAAGMAS
ncbi:MAG: NPCBM/NEW2 domain-containing protein [Clostridium perfringens]|nr:NPCBM/NEW2 domain-containing protein [Clostridium perfringens]